MTNLRADELAAAADAAAAAVEAGATLDVHASPVLLAAIGDLGFGAAIVSPDGRIVDACDRICQLAGRTRDELQASPHFSDVLLPEERLAFVEGAARRHTKAPVTGHHETVMVRPDGTEVPLELAIRPLHLAERWYLVVARDVTQRVRTTRLLQQHAAVADELPLGVCVWRVVDDDPRNLVLASLNRAAAELLDIGMDAVGSTMLAVFGPDGDYSQSRDLLDVGRRLRPSVQGTTLRDVDGGMWEWKAFPLHDELVAVVFEDSTERVAAEQQRLDLLHRLISVGDAERQRLALDLHDDSVQELAAASMLLGSLRRRMVGDDPRLDDVRKVEEGLQRVMGSLRAALFELHPPELTFDDLAGAIAASADRFFDGSSTSADIQVDELHLAPERSVRLYRIVHEALANVRRHASARSVRVRLVRGEASVVATIADDGIGFDTAAPGAGGHLGLPSMAERALLLGGTCVVASAPGLGTTVTVDVPLG